MSIQFRKATNRKTECYTLDINGHSFGISYNTIVCYWGPLAPEGARLKNAWGPTTGRHLRELGAAFLPIVSEEAMQKIIDMVTPCA